MIRPALTIRFRLLLGVMAGAAILTAFDLPEKLGAVPRSPIPLASSAPVQETLDFEYYRDNVEPIFLKSRGDFLPPEPGDPSCVMCHTWQMNTPLKLEPLGEDSNGGVFWTEEQSRLNFEAVSRLVVPGDPENSRFLRKPLRAGAGGTVSHTGGKFWTSQDDPEWQVVAEWVRAGAGSPDQTPVAPDVDFEFFRACVQPIFQEPLPDGLACINCHSEGAEAFVGSIPEGRSFWNEEESQSNFRSVIRLIAPGYPTQSRLLMHPLHPEGGGDYAHNGVRRWRSQNDPEWQMLAAWVRGERTGNSCQR
jgi:hypothetical protein